MTRGFSTTHCNSVCDFMVGPLALKKGRIHQDRDFVLCLWTPYPASLSPARAVVQPPYTRTSSSSLSKPAPATSGRVYSPFGASADLGPLPRGTLPGRPRKVSSFSSLDHRRGGGEWFDRRPQFLLSRSTNIWFGVEQTEKRRTYIYTRICTHTHVCGVKACSVISL